MLPGALKDVQPPSLCGIAASSTLQCSLQGASPHEASAFCADVSPWKLFEIPLLKGEFGVLLFPLQTDQTGYSFQKEKRNNNIGTPRHLERLEENCVCILLVCHVLFVHVFLFVSSCLLHFVLCCVALCCLLSLILWGLRGLAWWMCKNWGPFWRVRHAQTKDFSQFLRRACNHLLGLAWSMCKNCGLFAISALHTRPCPGSAWPKCKNCLTSCDLRWRVTLCADAQKLQRALKVCLVVCALLLETSCPGLESCLVSAASFGWQIAKFHYQSVTRSTLLPARIDNTSKGCCVVVSATRRELVQRLAHRNLF